ncbi:MAG: TraB/GumN family protein [Burkholderiales bacterium]
MPVRRAFIVIRLAVVALCMLGASAAQAQSPYDSGLLWRAERPGVAASHLFGTMHVDDPRIVALPPPVRASFDQARSFTMEVSLAAPNLLALAGRMLYTDGRTLEAAAGPELYRKLVPVLEARGMPEPVARSFRPWAAMMILAMPQQNSTEVLDFMLYRQARARGLPVFELETVDDQIGAFEGMPEANQVLMLKHTVETLDTLPRQTERLIQAYLARDLAAMWRVSEESTRNRPDLKATNALFERLLLTDRNRHMAERMQPQLQTGGAFVAVGALHLYGEQGVLRLLEGRGWKLTRVY